MNQELNASGTVPTAAPMIAAGQVSRTVGTFTVEFGIPIPEDTSSRRGKYPFAEMQIGESVLVAGVKKGNLRNILKTLCERKGVKTEMRACGDGFRVWRTA